MACRPYGGTKGILMRGEIDHEQAMEHLRKLELAIKLCIRIPTFAAAAILIFYLIWLLT